MSVYIEYVIIDNLVINSLILLCVKKTLNLNTKWWRILLSALLGTTVAVLLPLLNLFSGAEIIIKIFLAVIMVLILSSYLRMKDFVFSLLLFLIYTILLVGACMVTLLTFGTSLEALSAGGYDISVPLGILLAIVSLYVTVIIYIARFLSRRRDLFPYLRKIKIVLSGREFFFDAFVDSGNRLIDTKTGLPVIILSIKALEKYFSSEEIEALMLTNGGNIKLFRNVHKCFFNTISGEAKKMVVFEADKLVIFEGAHEYTTNRFIVGVTYKKFKDIVNYECLLNVSIMR